MKHLNIHKILLVLLLLFLISCNKESVSRHDNFYKEKEKIDKLLNEQKLSNYLRKLMIQNNQLMDKSLIFLDHEDFQNINEDDLNYSTMQIHKQDHYEFKARMFAYKWSLLNNKSKEKLVPYSVKPDDTSLHNWRSYLVLLMNPYENVLKKICFPSEIYENFALVTRFDKSCTKKIEKFYKFKILDDEAKSARKKEKSEEDGDDFDKMTDIKSNEKEIKKKIIELTKKKKNNKESLIEKNLRGKNKKKKNKKNKKHHKNLKNKKNKKKNKI